MKKKTAHKLSNTTTQITEQKKTLWHEYTDMFTMKQKPYNERFIERLAEELIKWVASNDDALLIEQFYLYQGISQQTWNNWVNKWPKLKSAHETAKTFIAVRREKGWITKDFSPDITRSLPLYSKDWKELEEWRSSLRHESEKSPAVIHIVTDKIPTTEEVKPRVVYEENKD